MLLCAWTVGEAASRPGAPIPGRPAKRATSTTPSNGPAGNPEGYVRADSKHKTPRIHAGTQYHPFSSAERRLVQLRFFDHWLKGLDTGIMGEAPVKLLIRKGRHGSSEWRLENEWPIKRT